ncbi:MAG: C40 family peptidase [Gemmatimonadales bacterium]
MIFGLALALAWRGASAQSISAVAAHGFGTPRVNEYRLSVWARQVGPAQFRPFATVATQGPSGVGPMLAGVGADVIVPLSASAQPYLVASVSAGPFDLRRRLGLAGWVGWSAGGGAELLRLGPVGVGVEARYQEFTRGNVAGVSLGLRVGAALGRRKSAEAVPVRPAASTPAPRRTESPWTPPSLATVSGPARVGADAVETALAVRGTPYRWGGTDTNGFDCSGLIQFAYGKAGMSVPRRSVEQATAGRSVGTEIADLAPGDILVFGREPGGPVTHVGLYVGDGRFIHSATGGTQISRLAADDPAGRWWFARWNDSRRLY